MMNERSLMIWDIDEDLPEDHSDVAYWQNYENDEDNRIFSLPLFIEQNADRLRSKYLALIYDLGESRVNGKRIVDHLEIRPNFSYWWMTLITEKCNFAKSPQIADVIKLLAFQELLEKRNYTNILIVSSNTALVETLRLFSDSLGITFVWQKTTVRIKKKKLDHSIIRRIYHMLPQIAKAFVWLGYKTVTRWSLKGVGVDEWINSKAKITFVSYLFNLKSEALQSGRYDSNYWGKLPDLMIENKQATNWLHIFVEDGFLSSAAEARNLIKRFNKKKYGNQVHATLSSFLSVRLIFNVLKDWYKLFNLKSLVCMQIKKETDYLWPLFEKDCLASMIGIPAMSNLLYLHLFEQAMGYLPTQERGCYLQENQGWEFSFIYSWQAKMNGGKLIGVPHSTVRYWDLRYFFDSRSYARTGYNNLPIPDLVGMNGLVAKQLYLDHKYPKDKLFDIEALRYAHLAGSSQKKFNSKNRTQKTPVILVLGGYVKQDTLQQIILLSTAMRLLGTSINVILKPHPACPIQAEDFPDFHMKITLEPIFELVGKCDLVYTGSETSAAVEAYCMGKQVVTRLDPKTLNMSPLKNNKGVLFVSTSKEMAAVLKRVCQMKNIDKQGADYFYLDAELPRWRALLFNNSTIAKDISLKFA
jgi:surface carbohydrate biosynthesis protein (TIGR04326 family)